LLILDREPRGPSERLNLKTIRFDFVYLAYFAVNSFPVAALVLVD
jgi:hypothetical protein